MYKRPISALGFLLAVLYSASASCASLAPVTIAGLTLGQPFTLPQCPLDESGNAESVPQTSCWVFAFPPSPLDADDPQWMKDENRKIRDIKWAVGDDPDVGLDWLGYVDDAGILYGVGYDTPGPDPYPEVTMQQLIGKLGKPTSVTTETLQNLLGAQVQEIEAKWDNQKVHARYTSCCTDGSLTDKGSVSIQTASSWVKEQKEDAEIGNRAQGRKF